MKITCTGRKVTLKDAFLERVDTKLAKLDKFFSDEGQAQVTGEVGPFPKQGCLEWWRSTENKQGWVSAEWVQQNNTGLSSVELLTQSLPASPSPSKRHKIKAIIFFIIICSFQFFS